MSLHRHSILHSVSLYLLVCVRCGGAVARPAQRGDQPAGEMGHLDIKFTNERERETENKEVSTIDVTQYDYFFFFFIWNPSVFLAF